MGKDWRSYELGKIGHSELLWWKKIEKVVNQMKLSVPSQSEVLQWEKIGKVVNWVKLAIPSQLHSICISSNNFYQIRS